MDFLKKIKENKKARDSLKKIKENKNFFGLLLLIISVKSSVLDWNYVPTGSMRPTLADGDQIIINKLAYDITIPLTYHSLYKISDPKRGDIVVFDTEKQDVRMVKRVLATPGDKIRIKNNKVYINNIKLNYEDDYTNNFIETTFKEMDLIENKIFLKNKENKKEIEVIYKKETINGIEHGIRLEKGNSHSVGLKSFVIPEDRYLMIGDNRNNSYDSRYWGLVERGEIVGKVNHVVFSLNQNNFLIPRLNRFFKRVD